MLGAAEWVWTSAVLVQKRLALGQQSRPAIILGTVALLTAAAALVFERATLREGNRLA